MSKSNRTMRCGWRASTLNLLVYCCRYINGILGGWPITLLIVLINVGLLLHQSLVWLPLYSLVVSTGCQPNLAMLKYAAELDIKSRLHR